MTKRTKAYMSLIKELNELNELKSRLKLIAPTLTSHENDLISGKRDVNW